MLLSYGVGEDSWESLGLQGDPTSPFWRRSTLGFFGRNVAKAETPVLWPPYVKRCLIGKDSDAGRDWGQEEKGTTQDKMAGWQHGLDGRASEWTPGVGDGQGGLACCNSWGRKESDPTEWLKWTELSVILAQPSSDFWMWSERVSCPVMYIAFCDSIAVACQAPLSMKFSKQEYWLGLSFPSLRDLPDARIKPESPALQSDSLLSEPPGTLF